MGQVQHALISDPCAVAWLSWALKGLPKESCIWPFSMSVARSCLNRLKLQRGLQDSGLTLASCRAGGATALFESNYDVARLLFKGRWRNIQTLHAYVQEAMSAMVLLSLSPEAVAGMRDLVRSCSFLELPPPIPWERIFSRPDVLLAGPADP